MADDYRARCLAVKGKRCSICASKDEIHVHHVDGDRDNGSIDNLKPVCTSCHSKIHSLCRGYEKWSMLCGQNPHKTPIDPITEDDEGVNNWMGTPDSESGEVQAKPKTVKESIETVLKYSGIEHLTTNEIYDTVQGRIEGNTRYQRVNGYMNTMADNGKLIKITDKGKANRWKLVEEEGSNWINNADESEQDYSVTVNDEDDEDGTIWLECEKENAKDDESYSVNVEDESPDNDDEDDDGGWI